MWRAVAGHREQLEQALSQVGADSKVPVGRVMLQHLEGGPWQFLAIERYDSWQDFATDQTATLPNTRSGQDA